MFEMFEMQGLVDLVELEVGVNYKGLRFLIDLSENKRVLRIRMKARIIWILMAMAF